MQLLSALFLICIMIVCLIGSSVCEEDFDLRIKVPTKAPCPEGQVLVGGKCHKKM